MNFLFSCRVVHIGKCSHITQFVAFPFQPKAPFLPPATGEGDTSNFDEYDEEPLKVSSTVAHAKEFESFWERIYFWNTSEWRYSFDIEEDALKSLLMLPVLGFSDFIITRNG